MDVCNPKRMQRVRFAWTLSAVLWLPLVAWGQTASFSEFPQDNQLYPRDLATNTARVPISGLLTTPGIERISVQFRQEGVLIAEQSQALTYTPSTAPAGPNAVSSSASFSLEAEIMAGPRAYDIAIYADGPNGQTLLHKAGNVVAGDNYLVYGQSNGEALDYQGSANENQHPNVRTFGTSEHDGAAVRNDRSWHTARGSSRAGRGVVGQWALRLGKRIYDTYGIPVNIINGSVGGRNIEDLARRGNPLDLNSYYGQMLYRAQQAGVHRDIRAVFWYHGESDGTRSPSDYASRFRALYNGFKSDYRGIEKFYIYQIRESTCSAANLEWRDKQRQLGNGLPDVVMLSTTAVPGHDGCHYAYSGGYKLIGDQTFLSVARDLYNGTSRDVAPPHIEQALISPDNRSIRLIFQHPGDAIQWQNGAEQHFSLLGSSTRVSSARGERGVLTLTLNGKAGSAFGISLRDRRGNIRWITNARGVGALSFFNIPLTREDFDGDGRPDGQDNCPSEPNPNQEDLDGDRTGDACDTDLDGDAILNTEDNCPATSNAGQDDFNNDGIGDACGDADNDRVVDQADNCRLNPNTDQNDFDTDGLGDACDDSDNDTISDAADNCKLTANPDQGDFNGDGSGDACSDTDSDTHLDLNDNCPSEPNPDQSDLDNDGLGNPCDDDDDNDHIADDTDNCPLVPNPDQTDDDGDGRGNACDNDADGDRILDDADNCLTTPNPDQSDIDDDGQGDLCDDDDDGDALADTDDNCPLASNPDQSDIDGDGAGDACDQDTDGDDIPDATDNCPLLINPNQADLDQDGTGNLCDDDLDGDSALNTADNCPLAPNPDQSDIDQDGTGDPCDADADGDTLANRDDNCPLVPNPNQEDLDEDTEGDVCDADVDGDLIFNDTDNCPRLANAMQNDLDQDGQGDKCDADIDGDLILNEADNCPSVNNPIQADADLNGVGNACDDVPNEVVLFGNYPNPFLGDTVIQFALPEQMDVRLYLYDLHGRRVRVLAEGQHRAGTHTILFNGTKLPSGAYTYTLQTGDQYLIRTLVVAR